MKRAVVFISSTYRDGNAEQTRVGTGFLVIAPLSGSKNRGKVWLVTAKHVLRRVLSDGSLGGFVEKVTVRFNVKKPLPNGRLFAERVLPVLSSNGSLEWFIDETDETVDLAMLPITPNESEVDAVWIPTTLFATSERLRELEVNENDEVLFAGLLPWYPGKKKNYPIVRHGKLALLPDERIPIDRRQPDLTASLYLAEITSFGGNSGSPVFLRLGGFRDGGIQPYQYYLIGVMQGFFSEASEVLVRVVDLRGVAWQNSGIAAVVPADKVLGILSTPKAKKVMDDVNRREASK